MDLGIQGKAKISLHMPLDLLQYVFSMGNFLMSVSDHDGLEG